MAQLATRWSQAGVLIFRRQALSEDELVAFVTNSGHWPDVAWSTISCAGFPNLVT